MSLIQLISYMNEEKATAGPEKAMGPKGPKKERRKRIQRYGGELELINYHLSNTGFRFLTPHGSFAV